MKKKVWKSVAAAVALLALAIGCEQPTVETKPTEPEQKPLPVTGVKLDRSTLSLAIGETAELQATVEPANAAVQTVTWSTEQKDVVELTDNGNGSCTVKGIKEGTATVTVTTADGGKTARCTVTVSSKIGDSITNTVFIEAVEKAVDIGWEKEDDGTVKLTAENLKKI